MEYLCLESLDQPYLETWLPEPSDAETTGLRQMTEGIEKGELSLLDNRYISTVTCLEAPSNRLAIKMEMARLGLDVTLELSVVRTQYPDPRVPRVPVEHLLWKYNGDRPFVAVPEPMASTADAVTHLASQPYDRKSWWELAGRVARDTRPSRFKDVLWVMVHPRKPPTPIRAWVWIRYVQVAAAFVIAQLDTGWKDSFRRQALFSLANGPMDWTVDAAIIALTVLAMNDPKLEPDVIALFRELRAGLSSEARTCYEELLHYSMLYLPGMPEPERNEARRRLLQLWRAMEEAHRRLAAL